MKLLAAALASILISCSAPPIVSTAVTPSPPPVSSGPASTLIPTPAPATAPAPLYYTAASSSCVQPFNREFYTILRGDTLSGIADDTRRPGEGFSERLEELIWINNIQDPNLIIENEQLLLRNDGQRPGILLPSSGVELAQGQHLYMPVRLQGLLCDSSFLAAIHLPPGASFRNSVLEWTPKEVQFGSYFITFIARDDNVAAGNRELVLTVRGRQHYDLATDGAPSISYKAINSPHGTILTVDGRSGYLLQTHFLDRFDLQWAIGDAGSDEAGFLRLHNRYGAYSISRDDARVLDHFRRVRTLSPDPPFNFGHADTMGWVWARREGREYVRVPVENYRFLSVRQKVESPR